MTHGSPIFPTRISTCLTEACVLNFLHLLHTQCMQCTVHCDSLSEVWPTFFLIVGHKPTVIRFLKYVLRTYRTSIINGMKLLQQTSVHFVLTLDIRYSSGLHSSAQLSDLTPMMVSQTMPLAVCLLLCLFNHSVFALRPLSAKTSKILYRKSVMSSSASDTTGAADFKLLVLGGTGFVGREVVKRARQKGFSVASISRRGKLVGDSDQSVTWVSGDASQVKTIQAVIDDFGPFDGCIHAVGLLLDTESGLSALNKYASGSGSSPTSESTYDRITRQTGDEYSNIMNLLVLLV